MFEVRCVWENDGEERSVTVKTYKTYNWAEKSAYRQGKDAPSGVWYTVIDPNGKIVYVCDNYGFVHVGKVWQFHSAHKTQLGYENA